MWDEVPFVCEERVEGASLEGYHREFNKGSWERWGSRILPGPTLGLESGGECVGTLFRISEEEFDLALQTLQTREGESFKPVSLNVVAGDREVEATVFVNKESRKTYIGRIPIETRAQMMREAKGTAGRCLDYVRKIAQRLREFGIEDSHLDQIMNLLENMPELLDDNQDYLKLGGVEKDLGLAQKKYSEEYRGRGERYLRRTLGHDLVLFKQYSSEEQVDYWLFKRPHNSRSHERPSGNEQVVQEFDIELSGVRVAGRATFLFLEFDSVYLYHIEVDKPFRRKGLATWLTKFHIDGYHPGHSYRSVMAEARTPESKEFSKKLGMVKTGEDLEFDYWYMRLDSPRKLKFPEDCRLETFAERIEGIAPSVL
jgi:cation transport regulator ChaC/predicted GNAT family acetyltransferase